jgi:hypothetical protein
MRVMKFASYRLAMTLLLTLLPVGLDQEVRMVVYLAQEESDRRSRGIMGDFPMRETAEKSITID